MWVGAWILSSQTFNQQAVDLVLAGNQLSLVNAKGEQTARGLRIIAPREGKTIAVIGEGGKLAARQYDSLVWDIEGLTEALEMTLIWQSSAFPRKSQLRPISTAEWLAGRLQLRNDPGWQGQILKFGLLIGGGLAQPLLVKTLTLEAAAPTIVDFPLALASDWVRTEYWSPRSINFHSGATRGQLLTPVSTLALWLGLSSFLFIAWRPFLSIRPLLTGLALMILAGWLLLDLRWQWQLALRLQETYNGSGQMASGVTVRDLPDAPLLAAIDQVRQALPAAPARLFILTEDPGGFMAVRLRYHLLPHRGYAGLTQLPDPATVAAGDAILVLSTLTGIHYDRRTQRLLGAGGGTLAADQVMKVPGFGSLYRATGVTSR